MTVYKPIKAEAAVAAAVALALRAGDDIDDIESEFEFTIIGINAEDGDPPTRRTATAWCRTSPWCRSA